MGDLAPAVVQELEHVLEAQPGKPQGDAVAHVESVQAVDDLLGRAPEGLRHVRFIARDRGVRDVRVPGGPQIGLHDGLRIEPVHGLNQVPDAGLGLAPGLIEFQAQLLGARLHAGQHPGMDEFRQVQDGYLPGAHEGQELALVQFGQVQPVGLPDGLLVPRIEFT